MTYILIGTLAFVAGGVIIAGILEYRKAKKRWKSYEREVTYNLHD